MLSIVVFARICPIFLRSVVSPCLTNKQVRSALGNFCSFNWELLFWPYDCFGFDNFSLVTSLTLRCHCKGWLVHSVSIPKYVFFPGWWITNICPGIYTPFYAYLPLEYVFVHVDTCSVESKHSHIVYNCCWLNSKLLRDATSEMRCHVGHNLYVYVFS